MKNAIADIEQVLTAKEKKQILNPHRTVIEFPQYHASSLYMPSADLVSEVAAVKVVTIFPNNPSQGKPTTQGVVLISDAQNGEHLAFMNASYLTRLRTGALSGIATKYLAKKTAKVLTVIGTGAMAFEQVLGVLEVRAIEQIILINRSVSKAFAFKEKLQKFGIDVPMEVSEDVRWAVRQADIICCATRSEMPVFQGEDLKEGVHINGVGSYLPHMREVDEITVTRAAKIVVDDEEGVKVEAGELIYAQNQNIWSFQQIHSEVGKLVTGERVGRENDKEITFFKSVGAAYFDLAVAKGVYMQAIKKNYGTQVDI